MAFICSVNSGKELGLATPLQNSLLSHFHCLCVVWWSVFIPSNSLFLMLVNHLERLKNKTKQNKKQKKKKPKIPTELFIHYPGKIIIPGGQGGI